MQQATLALSSSVQRSVTVTDQLLLYSLTRTSVHYILKYYMKILTSKLTTSDLMTDNGRSTPNTCTRHRLPNRVRVGLIFAAICNAAYL